MISVELSKYQRALAAKQDDLCIHCKQAKRIHGRMGFACPPNQQARFSTMFETAVIFEKEPDVQPNRPAQAQEEVETPSVAEQPPEAPREPITQDSREENAGAREAGGDPTTGGTGNLTGLRTLDVIARSPRIARITTQLDPADGVRMIVLWAAPGWTFKGETNAPSATVTDVKSAWQEFRHSMIKESDG